MTTFYTWINDNDNLDKSCAEGMIDYVLLLTKSMNSGHSKFYRFLQSETEEVYKDEHFTFVAAAVSDTLANENDEDDLFVTRM